MPSPLSNLRLCVVSVDLDEIPNYHAIHGLGAAPAKCAHAVYDLAIGRMQAFAAAQSVALTLFTVGADLDRAQNIDRLRRLAADGHEIANHTHDHRYDLTRLPIAAMKEQVERCSAKICDVFGARPTGFRSPGYLISDALVDVLTSAGIQYDTSVFPCPPYFAAKAAAMALIRLRGRSSHSIQDHPRVLLAPARPYRMGSAYHRRGTDGIVELPVQVTRGLRMPFIGTTITMAGERGAKWLTRMVIGEPVVSLELHGIDWLDVDDGLESLIDHQPDVGRPLSTKYAAIQSAISCLRDHGYQFVCGREAAEMVASRLR